MGQTAMSSVTGAPSSQIEGTFEIVCVARVSDFSSPVSTTTFLNSCTLVSGKLHDGIMDDSMLRPESDSSKVRLPPNSRLAMASMSAQVWAPCTNVVISWANAF